MAIASPGQEFSTANRAVSLYRRCQGGTRAHNVSLAKLDVAAVVFFEHLPDTTQLVIITSKAIRSADRAKGNRRAPGPADYLAAIRSRSLKFDVMLAVAFHQVFEVVPL